MGLFQYNRLLFGVSSTPAIFQKIMSQMIAGLPGVVAYLDDILILTRNQAEHLKRVCQVCTRLTQLGFRVKNEKCSFATLFVNYLSFIVNSESARPDPEKITAIQYTLMPSDVSSIRACLGFVNHYAK